MKAMLVYQNDTEAVASAALTLTENGVSLQQMRADEVTWGAPPHSGVDVVIVFSEVYQEAETLEICRRARDSEAFGHTPLLVAVNMYQMPLANRVKAMQAADFIFTPVDINQLKEKTARLREGMAHDRGDTFGATTGDR